MDIFCLEYNNPDLFVEECPECEWALDDHGYCDFCDG